VEQETKIGLSFRWFFQWVFRRVFRWVYPKNLVGFGGICLGVLTMLLVEPLIGLYCSEKS